MLDATDKQAFHRCHLSARPTLLLPQGAPFSSIPKPQIETGVKAKIPASACSCRSPGGAPDWAGDVAFSERGSHSSACAARRRRPSRRCPQRRHIPADASRTKSPPPNPLPALTRTAAP